MFVLYMCFMCLLNISKFLHSNFFIIDVVYFGTFYRLILAPSPSLLKQKLQGPWVFI